MKYETKYFVLEVPTEDYREAVGEDVEESMTAFLKLIEPFLNESYEIGYQQGIAEASQN